MKHLKRTLLFLLFVLTISSVFSYSVFAEDNASSGGGSSGNAGKGMGWYSNGQYMWKVSLYVGKSDRTTNSDNLINDFYLVGNLSVYVKPTSCTAWSTAKYGAYNKVQYLNGASLFIGTSQIFITDYYCPVPPIAYSNGNLDTVKAYFGSTQTLELILNQIASAKGTSTYGLVSGLDFNIGGSNKSGWSADWLLPSSSMTNRVPWVIIYEPIIIAFLNDGVTKLAFTPTEYALAQINGWYNFCNRADGANPQYLQTLTRNLAPASVKLQESWFGYGVFNSGYNEIWSDTNVVYYGGWGMRWLPNIQEPIVERPEYGVLIREIGTDVQPNSTLNIGVFWRNYSFINKYVLCEILVDGEVKVSEYIYMNESNYVSSYDIDIIGSSTKTITARINWEHRYEENEPNNNSTSRQVTPVYSGDTTYDFSLTELSVTPISCYQGDYINVSFRTDNWNRDIAYSNIPVDVLIDGSVVKSDYLNFTAYGVCNSSYSILMSSYGEKSITARINWDKRYLENNSSNNSEAISVSVKKKYEFSVSDLTLTPSSAKEQQNVTVTFRTDSWDDYNSYDDIPVELLYNGKVLQTLYVDYYAYAGFTHTFTVNVGATAGINTITARVNWNNRGIETNPDNNTISKQLLVESDTDLSIHYIDPYSTYNEGTEVITSFYVYNTGNTNITPDKNNTVYFEVCYTNEYGYKETIYTSEKAQVIIPSLGSNLVYFKWKVPQNLAGTRIICKAIIDYNGYVKEIDENNNSSMLVTTITKVNYMGTPDTKFEPNKPIYWSSKDVPAASSGYTSWSEWVYENGDFVKKSYGIKIETSISLTPDINAFSSWKDKGQWYMRSGYGLSIYCIAQKLPIGFELPGSGTYTAAQSGFAYFPEFGYDNSTDKYRTLQYVDGDLEFYQNKQSRNNNRLHFTPLWYPDGNYIVYCQIYDFWTPAGMLSASGSGKMNIQGSCYNDWYITHRQ